MRVVKPKELPKGSYHTIIKYMPIACVDIVIFYNGKFLMGKRRNKPARGQWWLPGGRVWKGETQERAVRRKVFEETGLKVTKAKFLGVVDALFPDSMFHTPNHSICTVYAVTLQSIKGLRPDQQNSQLKWFSKMPRGLHPALKKELRLAGII